MTNPIDFYYSFKFLSLLTTDWKDTDAYKTGVIDDTGKLLIKISQFNQKQKDAYTYFNRIVFNIKRLLEKTPITRNKIATYATALYLIKEHINNDEQFNIILKEFVEYSNKMTNSNITETILKEEIANTSSGENIATYAKPNSFFARHPVFDVDAHTYSKCIHGKKPYSRWAKYVDVENHLGKGIREYAKKNPKHKIILKDEKTDKMIYIKR